jgi:hypothetical protein
MDTRCVVVQRTTALSPVLASVIVNVAEAGIVRQADAPVTAPRSSDQFPAGVVG